MGTWDSEVSREHPLNSRMETKGDPKARNGDLGIFEV